MPVLLEIRNKLMSPLKQALLGAALSINPTILEKAADKEIEKATEQIIDQIEKLGEEEIQNLLESIGPKQNEFAQAQGQNTKAQRPESSQTSEDPEKTANPPQSSSPATNNFAEDPKNDIINKNPEEQAQNQKTSENPQTKNPENQESEDPQTNDEKTKNPEKTDETSENLSPEEQQKLQDETEQKKLEEEEEQIEAKKKGALTQSLNSNLLQRGEIKKITEKIKTEEKLKKRLQTQIKKINITITGLQATKLGLMAAKAPFDFISWFFCFFIWTCGCCGIGIAVVPAAKIYNFFIERIIDLLESQIKKIEKNIKKLKQEKTDLENRIKKIDKLIKIYQIEVKKLQNKSLMEGIMKDKNNPYLQK